MRKRTGIWLMVLTLTLWSGASGLAQKTVPPSPGRQIVTVEPPDAQRTKNEFQTLLGRYPPTLRGVFQWDPGLMKQEQYLAPYPALADFLRAHPDIAANPAYYVGAPGSRNDPLPDHTSQVINVWQNIMRDLTVMAAFGLGAGLFIFVLRTFLDERRWNRLSRVQAEVHTKLLDRFSSSEELMAYIATPAGSKFLQSAPIAVGNGAASRSMGAPLSRIMWSVQAGLVLAAAGIGLMFASRRVESEISAPLQVMGILAMALGAGFAISAGVAYLLSQKMGLLDSIAAKGPFEPTLESTLASTLKSGPPQQ